MRGFASRRAVMAGFGLSLLVAFNAAPRVAAAQADPAGFIQALGTQGIQALNHSVPQAQRVAVFRQILDQDFDLADISRFVLGPYARSLSPQQQQEFMVLFRDRLARTYAERLSAYGGQPFRVTGTRPMGGETVVTSQVLRNDGPPVEIDWHVADRGGRMLVTDVVVNGVSQKISERQEFAGIIQRNGGRPESVIAALRQESPEGPGYGSTYRPTR